MKKPTLHLSLAAAFAIAGAQSALAQFDDVYYDPSLAQSTSTRTYASNDDYAYEDAGYDSEFIDANVPAYDADAPGNRPITTDDYTGYEYSSRIRRFARPYAGFGYYDPVYVDQFYYGGIRPGVTTALIYNSPYNYSAFRANRFGVFNDPFFYSPYASARFRNRAFNNGFVDPFYDPFYGGASAFAWGAPNALGWGGGAFGYGSGLGFGNAFGSPLGAGAYYCPPSWGTGNVVYNTPNALPARTSTVAERGNTRSVGTRGAARPTNTDRTPVPSRTSRGSDDQTLTRRSTEPSSAPSRSTTPATRSNGRVAPSRDNSRAPRPSTNSRELESRTSRPSYSTPSRSTAPSRSSSRPSYSAPRESSRPSYSSPSRSSSPSYSAPSRSSSPSSSSRGSSGSSSSRGGSPRSPR